jgi:hypothetical protein
MRLSGAVYDATRPERSFALVQLRPKQPAEVCRTGAWVGTYELVAIEPRGILLRNAEGQCWLRLVGDPDPTRRVTAPPPKARASKKKNAKSEVVVIGRRP